MKMYLYILAIAAIISAPGCRCVAPVTGVAHGIDVRLQYDSISREHVRYVFLTGDTIHERDTIREYKWRVRTDTITQFVNVPVEDPRAGYYKRCTSAFWSLVGALAFVVIVLALVAFLRR